MRTRPGRWVGWLPTERGRVDVEGHAHPGERGEVERPAAWCGVVEVEEADRLTVAKHDILQAHVVVADHRRVAGRAVVQFVVPHRIGVVELFGRVVQASCRLAGTSAAATRSPTTSATAAGSVSSGDASSTTNSPPATFTAPPTPSPRRCRRSRTTSARTRGRRRPRIA